MFENEGQGGKYFGEEDYSYFVHFLTRKPTRRAGMIPIFLSIGHIMINIFSVSMMTMEMMVIVRPGEKNVFYTFNRV